MNNIEILEHIAIAYIDDEEFSQYVSPEGRFITNKQLAQALENLIQENKDLKEENLKLHSEIANEVYFSSSPAKEIEKRYIPKSKVKEKIERKFLEAKGLYERGVQSQAQYTMKLLRDLEKELLEGE